MSEISTQLQACRYQEEQLLEQLRSPRNQTNRVGSEIAKSILGEVTALAARELIGMPSLGRKVGRAYVGQQQRQNRLDTERRIDVRHKQYVASITALLANIHGKVPKLTSSEVDRFVKRIYQAQSYVRLETRVSKTIVALQSIESTYLLANERSEKSMEKSPLLLPSRFPRLAAIRDMLPEVEPTLRNFVRSSMKKVFNGQWQETLRSKFPKESHKWQEKSEKRSGLDPLDGQTFGELIHTIEAIPELRKSVASKPEFSLALGILNMARPMFIHPIETQAKDVDEEDVRKIVLAIETIVDVISKSS